MRLDGIKSRYRYSSFSGTKRVKEVNGLMNSKSMKFPNNIVLMDQNFIWYENFNGDQLNLDIETELPPLSDSSVDIKFRNSNLNRNKSGGWELKINHIDILSEYIFTNLKQTRAFEGISGKSTPNGIMSDYIKSWVDVNVIPLYKFDSIELFIDYVDSNSGRLLLDNRFVKNDNKLTNYSLVTDQIVVVNFNTQLDISKFSFNYYYNIKFTKV